MWAYCAVVVVVVVVVTGLGCVFACVSRTFALPYYIAPLHCQLHFSDLLPLYSYIALLHCLAALNCLSQQGT